MLLRVTSRGCVTVPVIPGLQVQIAFSSLLHICILDRVRDLYEMSQEAEDVKPKLNLNITYDGAREIFFSLLLGYSFKGIV